MNSAMQEWKRKGHLPLAAMVGVTGSSIFSYASGVFMEPMTREFGWSRTEYFFVVTLQMLCNLVAVPVVGVLIDRFGSRAIALPGCLVFMAGIALLGMASGSVVQWWALGMVLIVCTAPVSQPVWVAPVARQFHASRGLAMATALSGNGVGTMIWPILSTVAIAWVGWRAGWALLAVLWGVVALPLTMLLFFDGEQQRPAVAAAAGPSLRGLKPVIASRPFQFLTLSGCLFSCAVFGLSVHIVPMLHAQGVASGHAAMLAGLVGLAAIVGRVGTGYLLDRYPAKPVGICVFLLPVAYCLAIANASGSISLLAIAAGCLGLGAGAEIDVVPFIAARLFDRRIFGSIYSIVVACFGICASAGPLLAGALYDATGSYEPFLLAAGGLAMAGACLMLLMPSIDGEAGDVIAA